MRPFLLTFVVLLGSVHSLAQVRPRLVDDQFNVDLYQGPVLGSSRVIGLGGAYTAIGSEAVGLQFNPASAAKRPWYSRGAWDWDLTADWLIPNITGSDRFSLDNSALPDGTTGAAVINVGGYLQYKGFGLGSYLQFSTFDKPLPAAADGASRTAHFTFAVVHLSGGYAFLEQQLIAGVGLRIGSITAEDKVAGRKLLDVSAGGIELGLLGQPRGLPMRFGATFFSALGRSTRSSAVADPGVPLPHDAVLPWQLAVGMAWQVFGPELNPAPSYEQTLPPVMPGAGPAATAGASAPSVAPARPGASAQASAPQSRPPSAPTSPAASLLSPGRERGAYTLLLTVDVQVAAPVDNAVGIAGFLAGLRDESGRSYSVSPRAGAESEVWPRRLRLRAGTYYEPSRFESTSGRLHGTFGLDLRLFDFNLLGPRSLRAGVVGDFARNYSNLGVSLGFWH